MARPEDANDDVSVRYAESETERLLVFEREAPGGTRTATVAQNRDGYAMLSVRDGGPTAAEVERYYGLDVAIDHVAELLGVEPSDLRLPPEARDMGM